MRDVSKQIISIVHEAVPKIMTMDVDQIRKKPDPNKWSKIEILGHLIDSAINNIQRLTEIPFMKLDYQFRTYEQDKLVESNGYQFADLQQVIMLWTALNNQIAYVINQLDEPDLELDVYIKPVERVSLQFLIDDYVDHLKHHLDQVFKEDEIK